MGILATVALAVAIQTGVPPSAAQADLEAPGPSGPERPLRGTLVSPAGGDFPVVLIVPGSGPTDRNGNGPSGLQASTYRLLANGLLDHGIASVRIDKRGMFGSASAIPDADNVTLGDYAADVHAWVTTIRERTGVSCVWVLGHSEGGLVALVAAQHATDICGVILLAAAGRPFGTVLREQLRNNLANAPLLGNAMSVLDALEAGHTVEAAKIDPALMPLFRPRVQRFLISELTVDPASLLAAYKKPVLIVQGEEDLQVGPDDAQLLKRADPQAAIVLIGNANHVFKTVRKGDRQDNVAAYSDPDRPLAAHVVDAIAAFVKR